jgi:ribose 1,5-bisphosphokinase
LPQLLEKARFFDGLQGHEGLFALRLAVQRHQDLADTCGGCLKVSNDGPLHESGDTFVGLILHYSANECLQSDRCISS